MKKLTLFLFLMFLTSATIFSQNHNFQLDLSKSNRQRDVAPLLASSMIYKKPLTESNVATTPNAGLRNAGIIVGAAGVCMIGGGIAMIVDAGTAYYSYSNTNGYVEESGSPEGGLGAVMVGVGALATAGGVVMILIGQKKIKRAKARTSFNLSPVFTSFTYRF